MQVAYLGPLEVRDGDRLVAVPGARLQHLLIALALDPGRRWVSAGSLAPADTTSGPMSAPMCQPADEESACTSD